MVDRNAFNPNYSVHPGEFIEELLEYACMEHAELAMRLDITPKHVSNIVHGKAAVTAKTAVALEYVFPDRPAHYWLNLQEAYDVFEARSAIVEGAQQQEKYEAWLSNFDLDELMKAGYIAKECSWATPPERALALLKFFGCSSVDAWYRVYGRLVPWLSGRRWDERGSLSLAWLRKGQLEASRQAEALPRFDRRSFGRTLRKLRPLALRSDKAAIKELKQQCESVGVALCLEEPLPTMQPVSAAYWLKATPCIQLSKRVQTNDEWWLSFAHEAAYVMEGKTYEVSLYDDECEVKPFEMADSWLVSGEQCLAFASKEDFSRESVEHFADQAEVHPGIIVGMLQRARLVPGDTPLNTLKSTIEYAVVDLASFDE